MKWIRDRHLGSLLAWVVIVVAAIMLLPNVNALTHEHSNITLPSNVQSEVADTMRNHWNKGTKNTYETALVFNNGDSAISQAVLVGLRRQLRSCVTISRVRHQEHDDRLR